MYWDLFDKEFYPQLKDLLRKQMRKRKSQLSQRARVDAEQIVFDTIDRSGVLGQAEHILLYYSLPDELPTHATVDRWAQMSGRKIYLPRVNGDDIEIVPYLGADSLSDENPFHIAEPIGASVDPSILQAAIVPGVAFDRQLNRMGRGKGYYDRLLSQRGLYSVGVGFDCQIVSSLPCEAHDQPLCCVISPSECIIGIDYPSFCQPKS